MRISEGRKPRLAVTMGDPAGIGPEITLRALRHPEIRDLCVPVVFGDVDWIRKVALDLGLKVRIVEFAARAGSIRASDAPVDDGETATILVRQATDAWDSKKVDGAPRDDLARRGDACVNVQYGKLSAVAGRAAAQAVIAAATATMAGEFDAVVTAPLNKEALALGGYPYPGHTELLADVTKTQEYGMMLQSGPLRVVHVSTHVSLVEAIARVKTQRILQCIRLGYAACRQQGIQDPRVAVAGLNPHAGENRMFGSEDAEEIAPAVAQAIREGIRASGPHPADTVFARAVDGAFDLVVAMYHDQGHIPVKLHGFDSGVNITLGLPIIRVSVDHGTAFDIAGQGGARERSMCEALRVAALLVTMLPRG